MANYSANGGDLFAYGGDMQNQLTEFNEGKTHEQNPNGGVMQGTGANGRPNLVEEGETKHEDYIFSDRLKVDKQSVLANGLPGIISGKTFADASKILNKEAKERPNDPISTKAVKANLAKLTAAQEAIKAAKEAKENPQQQMQLDANMLAQGYANGGFMDQSHYTQTIPTGHQVYAMGGNIYDGETEDSQQIPFAQYGQRFNELAQENAPVYELPKVMTATTKTSDIINPVLGIDSRKQYAGSEYQKNKIMNKVAQNK